MSYVTLEVEIDHGRVVTQGSDKLPDRAAALLTILQPTTGMAGQLSPLEALTELQRRMQMTPEKADAWIASIRDGRR
jgi:hypothetical protein